MTLGHPPTTTYRTRRTRRTKGLIQTVDSDPAYLGRRPTPNLSLSTRCRDFEETTWSGEKGAATKRPRHAKYEGLIIVAGGSMLAGNHQKAIPQRCKRVGDPQTVATVNGKLTDVERIEVFQWGS